MAGKRLFSFGIADIFLLRFGCFLQRLIDTLGLFQRLALRCRDLRCRGGRAVAGAEQQQDGKQDVFHFGVESSMQAIKL